MTEWILGINTVYHESAACLLADGRLVALVEEERFNRIRHGKRSRIDNSDDLPEQAIAWCLAQAGVAWSDLAGIGYSFDPDARLAASRTWRQPGLRRGDWGTEEGEQQFWHQNQLAREKLQERAPRAEFAFIPHHVCHAASAFYPSPYERAAVLVVDGIGEGSSTWLGVGGPDGLQKLEEVDYPHSLGFLWEKMSVFLGLDPYKGPGKLMGYGAITDPIGELTGHDHLSTMREIAHTVSGGTFEVDDAVMRFRLDDFRELERRFGPRRPALVDRYEEASIAAALQEVTNEIMVHLATRLHRLTNGAGAPVHDLCMAGGVALNCVSNTQIAARTPFRRVWVQPAANDAGTALGAAIALYRRRGGSTRDPMLHAFWGPGYGLDAIEAAIDRAGLDYETLEDPALRVAEAIESGQVVAWFQGRQEVGPRALGHRSILCDPTRFDSRNRLNAQVKLRESFRPFAPSVLPQALERFFEMPCEEASLGFMLFALPLKARQLMQVIPAVIQENGSTGEATSRIQLVEPEHNPEYADVIGHLERLTGIPVVLNTSFNINEPIVTSPSEAIATFARSSMDMLQLGPFTIAHPKRTHSKPVT